MNRYEFQPYYEADKNGGSGGASDDNLSESLELGNGNEVQQLNVAAHPGARILIEMQDVINGEPHEPSGELDSLKNLISERDARFAETQRSLIERVKALEEENKLINKQLETLAQSLEVFNQNFAALAQKIDDNREETNTEIQGIKGEVEKMNKSLQDFMTQFSEAEPKKPTSNGRKKKSNTTGEATLEKTEQLSSDIKASRGRKKDSAQGPDSLATPTATAENIQVKKVSQRKSRKDETAEKEKKPSLSPDAASASNPANSTHIDPDILAPAEYVSPIITVETDDRDGPEIIDVSQEGDSVAETPPSSRGTGINKQTLVNRIGARIDQVDVALEKFRQKVGKALDETDIYLTNLVSRRKKKEVDPSTPLVYPSDSLVPDIDPATLTPEELERYRANARDKFVTLYQNVFLGKEEKNLAPEIVMGGLSPLAYGIAGMTLINPISGALGAGLYAGVVTETRRHWHDENAFDQLNRFSFIDGRPGERFDWAVKLMQRGGRGAERAWLKNRLGLNNFKGERRVRKLVKYLKDDGTLEIPNHIFENQEKVDRLLFDATWYLDATQALVERRAYLTRREQENIRKNRPQIYRVWKALLDKKYDDVVKRSFFADRLYKSLEEREKSAFVLQTTGLVGIEAGKAFLLSVLTPLAIAGTTSYFGSVGNRAEYQVWWNMVGNNLEAVKLNVQNALNGTGELVSNSSSIINNDVMNGLDSMRGEILGKWNAVREWFVNNVGVISADGAIRQIDDLRLSLQASGGNGDALNGTVEWLRGLNENRMLTPEECNGIYQTLRQ